MRRASQCSGRSGLLAGRARKMAEWARISPTSSCGAKVNHTLDLLLRLRGGGDDGAPPGSNETAGKQDEEIEMEVCIWRTSDFNAVPEGETEGIVTDITLLPDTAAEEAQRLHLLGQFDKKERVFVWGRPLRPGGDPVFWEVERGKALKAPPLIDRRTQRPQIRVVSAPSKRVRFAESTDVKMQDADQRNQNYAGPSESDGPSGRGQLPANVRRTRGNDPWSVSVEEDIRTILAKALSGGDEHVAPRWNRQWTPSPDNSRVLPQTQRIPLYDGRPSLLLEGLPQTENDTYRSKAKDLRQYNEEIRQKRGGQASISSRLTMEIGPSGCGKTRTAYEACCYRWAFYISFSTETEPGSSVLYELITHLRRKYEGQLPEVGREQRLQDVRELVTRIILALSLGLLHYLDKYGARATPKGFLMFQLIGASSESDWLVKVWQRLLAISMPELSSKLLDVSAELLRRTGQSFFDIFVDEAHQGMSTLRGYFPDRTGQDRVGRLLLNAWVRILSHENFAPFHFNFIGTRFSMKATLELQSTIAKSGGKLEIFSSFGSFSASGASMYARQFLKPPPAACESMWGLVAGRYQFTARLIEMLMVEPELEWADAFLQLRELAAGPAGAEDHQSLLWKLRRFKANEDPHRFEELLRELRGLLMERYIVGAGCTLAKADPDLVNMGFCFLKDVSTTGSQSGLYWAVLKEPLAAMAVEQFLKSEGRWEFKEAIAELFKYLPEDSSMGLANERWIPAAQSRLLNGSQPLAAHDLFQGVDGLPQSFLGQGRIECLDKDGHSVLLPPLEGRYRIQKHDNLERLLVDFVIDPGEISFFVPERKTGLDIFHFARIGEELWAVFLQSALTKRRRLRSKAKKLVTIKFDTMYSGEWDARAKQAQLISALKEKGVKGILQVLVAYPTSNQASTHSEQELRRTGLLEADHDFQVVQVGISANNAHKYFQPNELELIDSLKPLFGTS